MGKYRANIRLLTEAIFGSGYSIPGSVDLEVVYDEYGLPYMKGKTFKGNLREEMERINHIWDGQFQDNIDRLLGRPGSGDEEWESLRFSDCRLKEGVRQILIGAVENGQVHPSEIREALTHVRTFTSVDQGGSHEDGSLRQMRVIKKGLEFQVEISCQRELDNGELGLLAASLRQLRHLGTMRTRGKGEVECSLYVLENGRYRDKTDYYLDKFLEEVGYNG